MPVSLFLSLSMSSSESVCTPVSLFVSICVSVLLCQLSVIAAGGLSKTVNAQRY